MNSTGHQHTAPLRYLAAAVVASAGHRMAAWPGATAGRTAESAASGQTIHLVAHEKQRKFFHHAGFGDEEIFRGILDNAAGTARVGIFAGTLTSVSANDSLNLATVDLQLSLIHI